MYGPGGIKAFEVKSASRFRREDLAGLRAFLGDYPQAQATLIYGGEQRLTDDKIGIVPARQALLDLPMLLGNKGRPA